VVGIPQASQIIVAGLDTAKRERSSKARPVKGMVPAALDGQGMW